MSSKVDSQVVSSRALLHNVIECQLAEDVNYLIQVYAISQSSKSVFCYDGLYYSADDVHPNTLGPIKLDLG